MLLPSSCCWSGEFGKSTLCSSSAVSIWSSFPPTFSMFWLSFWTSCCWIFGLSSCIWGWRSDFLDSSWLSSTLMELPAPAAEGGSCPPLLSLAVSDLDLSTPWMSTAVRAGAWFSPAGFILSVIFWEEAAKMKSLETVYENYYGNKLLWEIHKQGRKGYTRGI